jgi:hypothetical protein
VLYLKIRQEGSFVEAMAQAALPLPQASVYNIMLNSDRDWVDFKMQFLPALVM